MFSFLKYTIITLSVGALAFTAAPSQIKGTAVVTEYQTTLSYSNSMGEAFATRITTDTLADPKDPLIEDLSVAIGGVEGMAKYLWVRADKTTPVTLKETRVNSTFPRRGGSDKYVDNVRGGGSLHNGTDYGCLVADEGPVYQVALWGGTVYSAGFDNSYGWHVVIDHGHGFYTLYAHMGFGGASSYGGIPKSWESKLKKDMGNSKSSLLVSKGDIVVAGQPLGTYGTTGSSTGPHAHIELKICPGAYQYIAWRAGLSNLLYGDKDFTDLEWYYGNKKGFGAATSFEDINGIDQDAIVDNLGGGGA